MKATRAEPACTTTWRGCAQYGASSTGWRRAIRFATAARLCHRAGRSVRLAPRGAQGSGAADWLHAHGVPVPSRPNAWSPLHDGGLVARLGRSEFLVEDGPRGDSAVTVQAELGTGASGVYPVLRQDAALLVRGEGVHELFAQTCSIDFSAIPPQERTVTLTMMVGVAVTVIDCFAWTAPCYRIWCDGTYGAYLWDTLLEIAAELGGGAVGLSAVLPERRSRRQSQ